MPGLYAGRASGGDGRLRTELRRQFEASIATADRALSLPPVAYHDADMFARERDQVFGRGWIAIT